MANKHNTLRNLFTDIADAIREKTGSTDAIIADNFPNIIRNITTGIETNFEIIGGTTQPASPKENTIWVNTSTAITKWSFSTDTPNNPTEGMVWIKTYFASPISINAIKENEINFNLVNCHQYIGGSFIEKESKIYQSAQWLELSTEIFDITKGDDGTLFTPSSESVNITTTPGEYVQFKSNNSYKYGIYFNEPIDVTGLNSITIVA